jgi:hypothetical protein
VTLAGAAVGERMPFTIDVRRGPSDSGPISVRCEPDDASASSLADFFVLDPSQDQVLTIYLSKPGPFEVADQEGDASVFTMTAECVGAGTGTWTCSTSSGSSSESLSDGCSAAAPSGSESRLSVAVRPSSRRGFDR